MKKCVFCDQKLNQGELVFETENFFWEYRNWFDGTGTHDADSQKAL